MKPARISHRANTSIYVSALSALLLLITSCRGRFPAAETDAFFARANAIYSVPGQERQALRMVDSAAALAGSKNGYFLLRKYQFHKEFYYDRVDHDSNELYIDSIIYALETFGMTQAFAAEYATSLNNKGNYFFDKNDLDRAMAHYHRSKVVAAGVQDTCLLADQSYHLGMVTYRQQRYAEAIQHFRDAMQAGTTCPEKKIMFYRRQELINNIALSFFKLGAADSAEHYYRGALQYVGTERWLYADDSEAVKFSDIATGVLCGNIANVLMAKGAYDSAAAMLEKSIAINSLPRHDNTDAMYARLKLVELYMRTGRLPQAKKALDEAALHLPALRSDEVRRRWLYTNFEYHRAAGNTTAALAYLQEHQALKDTADAALDVLKQTDFSQQLKDRETGYRLELLTKDNELHKLYLWITIALIAVAIVIAVVIAISYRRSQRDVKLLTALNTQVQEQKARQDETMAQLLKSNRDMDRVLHAVAHDLRSPVNATIIMCDLIAANITDESDKELIDMVINASKSQLALINELVEFGREDSPEQAANRERADIVELGRQAAAIQQFNAQAKNQNIYTTLPSSPIYINADREKINRVVNNLLSNAIKFSNEGSDIHLSIDAGRGRTVVIAVKDDGIGIPEKYKPLIFEPFTSAKRYGTTGEKSFGLGLSICKRIVEVHGGRMWFESQEDKGSTFFMELPVA